MLIQGEGCPKSKYQIQDVFSIASNENKCEVLAPTELGGQESKPSYKHS